jgi:hypothetical protein
LRTAAQKGCNGTRRISHQLSAESVSHWQAIHISPPSPASNAPEHGRGSYIQVLEQKPVRTQPNPFPSVYILIDRRIERPVPERPAFIPPSNPSNVKDGARVEGRETHLNAPPTPETPNASMKGCSLSNAFTPSSFTLHEVGKGMFCLPGGSNRFLQCFCCPQYRVFCVFRDLAKFHRRRRFGKCFFECLAEYPSGGY